MLDRLEELLGKGAIPTTHTSPTPQILSTGFAGIDIALGTGGMVRGSIIEICGEDSAGKSSLVLGIVSALQKTTRVAYIDTDNNFDGYYADCMGVSTDDLLVIQPNAGMVFQNLEMILRLKMFSVIVVDSAVSITEIKEFFDEDYHSAYLSEGFKYIKNLANSTGTTIILTNQLRYNGRVITQAGGLGLKLNADVKLVLKKTATRDLRESLKLVPVYNRYSTLREPVELINTHGSGISRELDLLTQAIRFGVVHKRGSFYFYGDFNIGQGSNVVITEDLFNEIYNKLI